MTFNEKIVDLTTGEETFKPYTIEQLEEVKVAELKKAELQSSLVAKETARKAVLAKLGLTDDEIKVLLG